MALCDHVAEAFLIQVWSFAFLIFLNVLLVEQQGFQLSELCLFRNRENERCV